MKQTDPRVILNVLLLYLYMRIYCKSEYVQHINKNNNNVNYLTLSKKFLHHLLNLRPQIMMDRPEIISRSKHNA